MRYFNIKFVLKSIASMEKYKMYKIYFNTLVGAIFLIIQSSAIASDYKCTIKANHDLNSSGTLNSSNDWITGRKFVINGATGTITGTISNHNMFGTPKVLEKGQTNSPLLQSLYTLP